MRVRAGGARQAPEHVQGCGVGQQGRWEQMSNKESPGKAASQPRQKGLSLPCPRSHCACSCTHRPCCWALMAGAWALWQAACIVAAPTEKFKNFNSGGGW